ncbi:MAG TPA: ShlB/FhaC/HecB family hemolysin secretion/activation protein [Limnobacter sp.]|uniref:ShlB/FhaC/HecB family hemolysin secretion/activation protein n=1 Tax=Limnobacter sp. TaxID=2003368 RepID=UPI002ED8E0DB
MRLLTVLLGCAGIGWQSLAGAQVSTPASLLNESMPMQEQRGRPAESDHSAALPASVSPELAKPLSDVSVDVERFEIVGYAPADSEALHQQLQAYTGKGRHFEDLSNAVQVVTAYLQRDLGLYLAYAYLPAQNVSNGVVRIQVLPGVLEKVEVQWPAEELRVKRSVIEAHLNALKPGQIIRVSEVERVVFLLNDLRGVHVRFAVKPGDQPGTAVLVAMPSQGEVLSGSLALDANGSRYAGSNRATLSGYWESPLGLGDSLSFSHLQSDTGGLEFSLLGYTVPVGADGFKLGLNASTVHYQLNNNDFPLGLNGDASTVGVFGLYPLIRSRNLNLFALAGQDHRTLTDRQSLAGLETRKTIDSLRLALSGDARDAAFGGGLSFFNWTLEQSKTFYPAGRPFGLDDEPRSLRSQYSLSRLQTLIAGQWMLWAHVRGQDAYDNLDSSDQCALGGSTAVRAFAQGEAAGDTCTLATLELRHILNHAWLGEAGRNMSLNAFYDQGRVHHRNDASGRPSGFNNLDELAGYGFSWSWDMTRQFALNVSVAWPLQGQPKSDPKVQTPRLFATVTYNF